MRPIGCIALVGLAFGALALVLLITLWMLPPVGGFGPTSDFSFPLSGGYELSRTSAHQVRVHPTGAYEVSERPVIPAKVEAIAWDRRHILAMQRPGKYFGEDYVPPTEFRFWILDVEARSLVGPLTARQFNAQRSALGVAERLLLKPVRRPRTPFGW